MQQIHRIAGRCLIVLAACSPEAERAKLSDEETDDTDSVVSDAEPSGDSASPGDALPDDRHLPICHPIWSPGLPPMEAVAGLAVPLRVDCQTWERLPARDYGQRPDFQLQVLLTSVTDGQVLPGRDRALDEEGWSDVPTAWGQGHLTSDSFGATLDLVFPRAGSWVVSVRAREVEVSTEWGLCGRGGAFEEDWYWVPDPRPDGWIPNLMVWAEVR
jgi:hypothetical protein